MNHSFVVGELEGGANLCDQRQRLARLQRLIVEQMPKVHSIHILHDEVVILAGLAEIVKGDDAGMIELGEGFGFPLESFREGRATVRFHRQDFQRHQTVHARLAGLVHHPHAAHAQQFNDLQLWELRRQLGRVRRNAGARGGLGQRVDVDGGAWGR